MPDSKIKVMLVDDSPTARRILTDIVNRHPRLEVAASAGDPFEAVERLKVESPDVMVLDVQMPRMDGVTFLKKLMRIRPMPVVMCSSFTREGSRLSLECLENGAVDIICKPSARAPKDVDELVSGIHDTLISAVYAGRKTDRFRSALADSEDVGVDYDRSTNEASLGADAVLPLLGAKSIARIPRTPNVVVVGASTGGVDAIHSFLAPLPRDCPGVVVVQHMPEGFTESFANRLNEQCRIEVREARNGDAVEPGLALISPGNLHLILKRRGSRYTVETRDGPPVNRHRPSVDVLFRSAACSAGKNAIGVILTGMGSDGAAGMREMKDAGARNFAQNEATCVVFGMPQEAIKRGGVDQVIGIDALANAVLRAQTPMD